MWGEELTDEELLEACEAFDGNGNADGGEPAYAMLHHRNESALDWQKTLEPGKTGDFFGQGDRMIACRTTTLLRHKTQTCSA